MLDIKKIIALNIKRLRAQKGWTQHDLAAASGVSFRGIQDIETARRNPRQETITAISGAFGVDHSTIYVEPSASQPQQDLSQIKALITAAAIDLKQDNSNGLETKVSALEQELKKRDQEILNLKAKIKRLSDHDEDADAIDIDENHPEFKRISEAIQAEIDRPGLDVTAGFVESLFPKDQDKTKKGAG